MAPKDIVYLVANVGFPIVVAFYLLVRIEGVIRDLEKSIRELIIVIGGVSSPTPKVRGRDQ